MKLGVRLLVSISWVLLVGVGLGFLARYESAAGAAGLPVRSWPEATALSRAEGGCSIVMIGHPKCPCSRATIGELAVLMARCPSGVTATVLFFHPEGTPAEWAQTDLWRSAAEIPGVGVIADEGGVEADLFGLRTSGHALLFDARGQRIFSGGITRSRGHAGDNEGRSAIEMWVRGEDASTEHTPVYGCSVFEEDVGGGGRP